jgi:hypothetical protein
MLSALRTHMKNFLTLCLGSVLAVSAQATSFVFTPSPVDLNDLSHNSAYTWGISGTSETSLKNLLGAGATITSATLSIKNLYNWDSQDTSNQLFIHLLDNPLNNVATVVDDPTDNGINQGVLSDYFSGNIGSNAGLYYGSANGYTTNLYLTQYHDGDGPTTHINYTFSFSNVQLSTLRAYITNGHTGGTGYADFGLGFDPDCHYFNDGVTLTITVPDQSATLLLLGFGLAAMAASRRFLRM